MRKYRLLLDRFLAKRKESNLVTAISEALWSRVHNKKTTLPLELKVVDAFIKNEVAA